MNPSLTLFLGLRYELAGIFKEKSGLVANFQAEDGGYHIIPNESVRSQLPPGLQDPDSIYSSRVFTAAQLDLPETILTDRQEQLQPAGRLRLARRQLRQDRGARRLRPLPPDDCRAGAARPDGREPVPLHGAARTGGGLSNGFSGGTG